VSANGGEGGYGTEQMPMDMDSIADLQKLPALLRKRGYKAEDICNIMHGNFAGFLRQHLPKTNTGTRS
jgi:membrane dipeptidase